MADVPKNVRALQEASVLELVWPDDTSNRLSYRLLRGSCPCASCVNEFTGERVFGPDRVSENIRPTDLSFTGSYALKITWSDGHDTGLYTWEYLAKLCNST